MKSSRSYLGVDCSAYTTSLALVDGAGRLIWEGRRMLPVPEGGLGLRQSEALFAHVKNLPQLWAEGAARLREAPLAAVAAAVRPRSVEGSYMPVFKVSEAAGALIAHSLGLRFFSFSHQEGHLAAGLWSAGLPAGRYLAVHLSGGTTEILCLEAREGGFLTVTLVGGSSDLHAGQFVDRIGVALGLGFPAGPALEECARRGAAGTVTLPVAVQGTAMSFSGPASQARRLLEQGCDRGGLARAVEICIADSLAAALCAAAAPNTFGPKGADAAPTRPGSTTPGPPYAGVLVVGGVAANKFIRRRLAQKGPALPFHFAAPAFAGDNAAGLAVLAAQRCGEGGPEGASGPNDPGRPSNPGSLDDPGTSGDLRAPGEAGESSDEIEKSGSV